LTDGAALKPRTVLAHMLGCFTFLHFMVSFLLTYRVMPCRRAGKAVFPPLIQAKEEFFHFLLTRLGKSATFSDPYEPTFFQDAQRANIVFSGTGVQGAYLIVL
jgi:hypothetical protein